MTGPGNVYTDSTSNPGSISFSLTASAGTDHVNWSIDGNDQGAVLGCGTFCVIYWDLGKPTGGGTCDPNGGGTLDGTYLIQATAYDAEGLTDNPRAVTVQLNRCPPAPPTGLEGGMTKPRATDALRAQFPGTELQWDDSPEEDVIGYHVYKSTVSATGPWTPIAAGTNPDPGQPGCEGLVKTPNCVDADTTVKVWYQVAAVDQDPNGMQREGARSASLLFDPANTKPGSPKQFGVDNAFPSTIKWTGAKYGSPPPADYTDFYYVYRDAMGGRDDRYDSIDNDGSGATITWTDPDPGGVAHDYWVVAVDNHLAESDPQPDLPGTQTVHCDANGACVIQ
jgi:hypothetical protein